ncbi:MAG TPA: ADP-glyceromanno-heptose 6-epimerase [Saprospiraceae bacterium]|nr:ADP-glyceromanno-heptose 6-epimerase [Saprospiraceae bacterium]
MIIVTGAMGFIGSGFVSYLNQLGHQDIIVVDDFYQWKKEKNLVGKRVYEWIHRDLFIAYFEKVASQVDVIFHLGARTDTISEDVEIFEKLNLQYSKDIWSVCARHDIPLIYASSAATYGDGQFGFKDDEDTITKLNPLNEYAKSKHAFDIWALEQKNSPPQWYGLKFFNVYGPNEGHKGRMASVVFHGWNQIRESGQLKLFKSHRPDFKDGRQLRDFIYVKDIHEMLWTIYSKKPTSGIYNAGTGISRTFEDLGKTSFDALSIPVNIEYIDMPSDLREKYQYNTLADMTKWNKANLTLPGTTLEAGVKNYIQQYLNPSRLL